MSQDTIILRKNTHWFVLQFKDMKVQTSTILNLVSMIEDKPIENTSCERVEDIIAPFGWIVQEFTRSSEPAA
jgi:hypothetical protein